MDIKGFEKLYKVYKDGRVWSYRRKIFLSPTIDAWGYMSVILSIKGKQKRIKVHSLVANAYIPKISNKPYINHKDINKQNNYYTNLEWCTALGNRNHAKMMGRVMGRHTGDKNTTVNKVYKVRNYYINGDSVPIIAKKLYLTNRLVRSIVYGYVFKNIYPELISEWRVCKPNHGTHSRYCKGCRCENCKKAHALANKKYRNRL